MLLDNDIDGEVLLCLDNDALKEIGVSSFGIRYKLLQQISFLNNEKNSIKIKEEQKELTVLKSSLKIQETMIERIKITIEKMQEDIKGINPKKSVSLASSDKSRLLKDKIINEMAELVSNQSNIPAIQGKVPIKVFIKNGHSQQNMTTYKTVMVSEEDTVESLLPSILKKFKINLDSSVNETYSIAIVAVNQPEKDLNSNEKPFSIIKDKPKDYSFVLKSSTSILNSFSISVSNNSSGSLPVIVSSKRDMIEALFSTGKAELLEIPRMALVVHESKQRHEDELMLTRGTVVNIISKPFSNNMVVVETTVPEPLDFGLVPQDCLIMIEEEHHGLETFEYILDGSLKVDFADSTVGTEVELYGKVFPYWFLVKLKERFHWIPCEDIETDYEANNNLTKNPLFREDLIVSNKSKSSSNNSLKPVEEVVDLRNLQMKKSPVLNFKEIRDSIVKSGTSFQNLNKDNHNINKSVSSSNTVINALDEIMKDLTAEKSKHGGNSKKKKAKFTLSKSSSAVQNLAEKTEFPEETFVPKESHSASLESLSPKSLTPSSRKPIKVKRFDMLSNTTPASPILKGGDYDKLIRKLSVSAEVFRGFFSNRKEKQGVHVVSFLPSKQGSTASISKKSNSKSKVRQLYALDDLISGAHPFLEGAHLEDYLSNEDCYEYFGVSRDNMTTLPPWKLEERKKRIGLKLFAL